MTLALDDGDVRLYHGDALDVLHQLPAGSVDCCVTSPPYWMLRDYGADGQIGLEPTPDLFVHKMVVVFQEVRRVLADHGTCWVNLGDSYLPRQNGLKPKDLVGIPWRVAFALQADGWWLRSDIIWAKPNPMPESVTDRPTKSHEYVFLLTKQPRYWFDTEAVREQNQLADTGWVNSRSRDGELHGDGQHAQDGNGTARVGRIDSGRNVRSVWTIATQPYPEAHFATFPEELARRCILAGCPIWVCLVCGKPSERIVERDDDAPPSPSEAHKRRHGHKLNATPRNPDRMDGGGTHQGGFGNPAFATLGWSDCGHNNWRPGQVLDPFIGSGTTAKVARDHQRHAIGIDLNEKYLELAARRLQQLSLLNEAQA